MKKLLIIGLLLCLMSGCQKNTGTFAQGDKNLSSGYQRTDCGRSLFNSIVKGHCAE